MSSKNDSIAAVAVCRAYGESNGGAWDPLGRRAASNSTYDLRKHDEQSLVTVVRPISSLGDCVRGSRKGV